MFKSWQTEARTKILLSVFLLQLAGSVQGATVGQLSGNTGVWATSGNFSTIYAAATVGGVHTVESPQALTAQNIANNTHFIIESSALAMAAQQVSLVVDYVRGGGTLLLFSNPDQGGRTSANQILGALGVGLSGSAMSVTGNESGLSGSTLPWGTLSSTDSSVAGPVANLNGASLNWARTYILSGGQLLSQDGSPSISDAIRMDRFNLGRVYVFGTRLDSNLATGFQTLGTNAVFFQNILGTGSLSSGLPTGFVGGGVGSAPEPASFALTAFALAGVAVYARRRRS